MIKNMTNEKYINQATNDWIKLFINKSNLNSSDIDDLKNCIKVIIENAIVWKEKQMIDKSCEWLEHNFNIPDDFRKQFKKSMEE